MTGQHERKLEMWGAGLTPATVQQQWRQRRWGAEEPTDRTSASCLCSSGISELIKCACVTCTGRRRSKDNVYSKTERHASNNSFQMYHTVFLRLLSVFNKLHQKEIWNTNRNRKWAIEHCQTATADPRTPERRCKQGEPETGFCRWFVNKR